MLGLCLALSASAATSEKKQPDWSQLTPEQQHILAPLASDWNNFDNTRRKKWLLLAKRYPKMKPEQQQRLQTRMQAWAKLTPEQRRIARENYKKLAKQPPEKREAVKRNWHERQQLKQAAPSQAAPASAAAAAAPAPALPAPPAAAATPAAGAAATPAPPPAPAAATR